MDEHHPAGPVHICARDGLTLCGRDAGVELCNPVGSSHTSCPECSEALSEAVESALACPHPTVSDDGNGYLVCDDCHAGLGRDR